MLIEVSNGEIMDKLTIIDIKLSMIQDPEKRKNLLAELEVLEKAAEGIMSKDHPLYKKLYQVNLKLWQIEDDCRDCEKKQEFGEFFIHTARSVYMTNDERAAIKKEINHLTGSRLTEEKSYQ